MMAIIGIPALSQTYSMKGTVNDLPKNKVYLLDYYGEKNILLDSASADSSGSFTFVMKNSYTTGLYKVILGSEESQRYGTQEVFANIIFNKENIVFSTSFSAPADSMKVTVSEENKTYYDFSKKDDKVNTQLQVLSQLPDYFPPTDEFYSEIKERYTELQKQHQKYIATLIKSKPNLFAMHMIGSERFPSLEFSLPHEDKLLFVRKHFLDNIDFADTLLLHTSIFTSKAFAYIKFFSNQSLSKDLQEKQYIMAVDTLMGRSKVNEKVNAQIKKYLITGFESLEMETVLTHISTYYTTESTCEDDRQTKNLKRRVDGYKKLAIGNKAPDISITDENNTSYKLSDSKAKYTLILFWASWCPHCMMTLPEINKMYDALNKKGVEVVAISIDTVKAEFVKAIVEGGYKWINYSDLKGWDGPIASDYYLYATPTMLLLDADKKILAKPISLSQLVSELEKLGIIE